MRRVLAFSLLLVILAASAYAADSQQPANDSNHIDPWFKLMTVTFKDTPLPQAIEQLTKGMGVNYEFTNISTDPAELKVTAVFRNVPLEAALKQTITSAGLNYNRYGEKLSIWDPAWTGQNSMGAYRPTVDPNDYWQKEVKVDFKGTPFGQAVTKLFWGTPATYTVPEDVLDIPVTYSTGDIQQYGGYGTYYRSRTGVLTRICEQANVRYTIDGDRIVFELGRPQSTYMKNGHWTVYRSFSDTAFNKAIEALFRGTNILYRIKPGLEDVKVMAKMGELPLDDALKQVMDAAGATFTKEGETYVFGPAASAKPTVAAPNASNSALPQYGSDQYGRTPGHPDYTKDETIALNYVDASAVLPLAQLQPDLRIAKTGKRFVTVHGRLGEIQRFKDVMALVDKPESLPRAVRVTFKAVIEKQERIPAELQLSPLETENLLAEGMQGTSRVTASSNSLSVTVAASVVDPRPQDKRTLVSLSGQGTITLLYGSRTFDILGSLEPGKETAIASGNLPFAKTSLPFAVTAVAQIESDRVYLPSNDLQMGNSNTFWSSNAPPVWQYPANSGGNDLLQQFLKSSQQTQQGNTENQTPPAQQNPPAKP